MYVTLAQLLKVIFTTVPFALLLLLLLLLDDAIVFILLLLLRFTVVITVFEMTGQKLQDLKLQDLNYWRFVSVSKNSRLSRVLLMRSIIGRIAS